MKLPLPSAILILCCAAFVPAVRAPAREFSVEERAHWAFQPVVEPAAPRVASPGWCKTGVDAFILESLADHGLQPSAPADRATLIRRASLDLTGLPPTPEEVQAFVNDQDPQAFDGLVDRLLASPHYGERWARHWLDLARYAESEGFKSDETRPHVWRYRDYVIESLNADKPYDRFVMEQIAGDELWPADSHARVATAFNRHYPDESNARNLVQRRQEILNDITDTVGAVFLGMTFACARCHDHKFEPILQKDYYRLQAFFANTAAQDDIVLVDAEEEARYRERLAQWEEQTCVIRDELEALEGPKRANLVQEYLEKYPTEIQAALRMPAAMRSPFERQMAWKANQYLNPGSREFVGRSSEAARLLKGEARRRWEELRGLLEDYRPLHPGDLPMGTGVADLGADAPTTHLLTRGSHERPEEKVEPGFPSILGHSPARIPQLPGAQSTGRRTVLARWLTDPANPLPARVIVNRLWHHHFGTGLARTPSDLGLRGERPTHPALLDWLAVELIRNGWRLKPIHRLIMTSRAYQQSSQYNADNAARDMENRWLWRYPRQRLEGEAIRDSALAVAGVLDLRMGGPSIYPELPMGMPTPRGGWDVNQIHQDRNRRSVYVFARRNSRYPMFESFDMPDSHESCSRRNLTTGPIQALTLLNSHLTLDWARHFAQQVLDRAGQDRRLQVEAGFRLALGRPPDTTERELSMRFMKQHTSLLEERLDAGETLALPPRIDPEMNRAEAATLVDFCHALLNSSEFIHRP